MVRLIAAWVLIVVGLAAVLSGGVMIYTASVVDRSVKEGEQAEFRAGGYTEPAPRSERPDTASLYTAAAVSIVVGGLVGFLGVRLRPPPTERETRSGGRSKKGGAGSGKPKKRKCPQAAGLSPPGATNCYHCGKPIPAAEGE